jgi:hypothetical protein
MFFALFRCSRWILPKWWHLVNRALNGFPRKFLNYSDIKRIWVFLNELIKVEKKVKKCAL